MANKPIRLTTSKARQLSNQLKRKPTGRTPSARQVLKPSPYTYKKLMSETEFLKVKRRSMMVQGIDLTSIDFADNELRFLVNSVTTKGKRYTVVVRFNEIPEELVLGEGTHSLARILRQTGIKISCSCPANLFWGFQYKAERYNYAAFHIGVRYPHVRNPKLLGYTCKHVRAVLGVLASGTIMNSIAKKMKDWVSREHLDKVQKTLADSMDKIKVFGE